MGDIFFLDTNVIVDYLEKRNQDVQDIVAQLLHYHGKNKIVLATSVFNVVEVIDTEFQIRFIGECINERMSGDGPRQNR
jgi:predicted nucleic acid-binding protein